MRVPPIILMILMALLSSGQQGQDSQSMKNDYETNRELREAANHHCSVPSSTGTVVYCKSINLGDVQLRDKNSSAILSVEFGSEFFSGLERVQTPHGREFQKNGQRVMNYPSEFTLTLETPAEYDLDSAVRAARSWELIPRGLSSGPLPHFVIIRWLGSQQQLLSERHAKLEVITEPWPELRQPHRRYKATITGANHPLAAEVEVLVQGYRSKPMGSIRATL
jgi:hypothetical protein